MSQMVSSQSIQSTVPSTPCYLSPYPNQHLSQVSLTSQEK